MNLNWQNHGLGWVIDKTFKAVSCEMGLFTSPNEWNKDLNYPDITEVPIISAGNYERSVLLNTNWTEVGLGPQGIYIHQDFQNFTMDTAQTLLGYFLMNEYNDLITMVYFNEALHLEADQVVAIKPHIYFK